MEPKNRKRDNMSIITLNINSLNTLIKSKIVTLDKISRPNYIQPPKKHLNSKDTNDRKGCPVLMAVQRKPGLLWHQSKFQRKDITRDEESDCVIIKVSFHQEAVTILNSHLIPALQNTKQNQTELKGEMGHDFRTPLSGTEEQADESQEGQRRFEQHHEPTGPNSRVSIPFGARGALTEIDHILGHKIWKDSDDQKYVLRP